MGNAECAAPTGNTYPTKSRLSMFREGLPTVGTALDTMAFPPSRDVGAGSQGTGAGAGPGAAGGERDTSGGGVLDVTSPGPRMGSMAVPRDSVTWFALGDVGWPCEELRAVGRAMHRYALENGAPDFCMLLGDNFYPGGWLWCLWRLYTHMMPLF